MARITIDVDLAPFDALVSRLNAGTADFTRLLTAVAREAGQMVDRNFRAQGQPDRWAPLSPVTLARRRKGGGSVAILQDSGKLRNSIVSREVTGISLEYGTNLVYAATQQYGRASNRMYNTPKGNPAPIPARPYLPTPEEMAEQLIESRKVERYIADILGA